MKIVNGKPLANLAAGSSIQEFKDQLNYFIEKNKI